MRIVLTGLLTVAAASVATAQKPETWLTRLGTDTVAFERFTRTKDRLEGEFVVTVPRLRINKYLVSFNPDGTVKEYDYSSRAVVEAPGAQPPVTGIAVFEGGAIRVILTRGTRTDTSRVTATAGAVPNALYAWGLFGLATQAARRAKGDSTVIEQYGLGARQVSRTAIVRRGDSLVVDFFQLPMMVKADGNGRPQAVNGAHTTINVLAERVERLDLAALTESFAARERAGQIAGALSTRDTVVATVKGAEFWVDYGRPMKRGRRLYGGLVPYGEVWRTGANAATQIRINKALEINGTPIPAGMYTLWTLPAPLGVKLIISKQTGQWGTSYDPAQDLARVDAGVEKLEPQVERFTISVADAGALGELRFDWDSTRWVVRFRVP